jgi:hypothetical protein
LDNKELEKINLILKKQKGDKKKWNVKSVVTLN